MRFILPALVVSLVLPLAATSLAAKDSLGVFTDWGAFRDPEVPRCYAIAAAKEGSAARQFEPFASVGTWPRRQVRGHVHFQLSRPTRDGSTINLTVGNRRFALSGSNGDAWAQDRQMDAAIVAEMRAAGSMQISASDSRGHNFTDRYSLDGAATAMDAAIVGCSGS